MLIYNVEGDFGHLMLEQWGQQSFRSAVRGTGYSVALPWEDILLSLHRNISDQELGEIPRGQNTVAYLLRLNLKIQNMNIQKYLKQVHVRPFVLLLHLHYLIDQGHEFFEGKASLGGVDRI